MLNIGPLVYLDKLLSKKKELVDKHFEACFVVDAFYYAILLTDLRPSIYDILVLGILDLFIAFYMQKSSLLASFHNMPKLFMLSHSIRWPFKVLSLVYVTLHALIYRNMKEFHLVGTISLVVLVASQTDSRTLSCLLAGIVVAGAIGLFEENKEVVNYKISTLTNT